MFDIGFSELALISIIGLVVLGPERLPKAARTVGYWVGRARSTFNHLRNELEREARDSLLSPDEVARARRRPETLDQPDNQDNGQTPEAEKKPNE